MERETKFSKAQIAPSGDIFIVYLIILLIAGYIVKEFVSKYWIIILPASIIITIGWLHNKIKNKKKLKAQREKAAREAAFARAREIIEAENEKEQQQRETIKKAKQFINKFKTLITECFIIDSNIWMDPNYDIYFDVLNLVCTHENYKIVLYGVQFDEIVNIKKKTKFNAENDDRNKRARLAIRRIELLQKQGLLDIRPITINAEPNAYADPLILKLILTSAKKQINGSLITNDKELRIRARQLLSDNAVTRWNVLGMEELLSGCKDVVNAQKYSNFTIFHSGKNDKQEAEVIYL